MPSVAFHTPQLEKINQDRHNKEVHVYIILYVKTSVPVYVNATLRS